MKHFTQKENEYFFDEAIEIISTDIKDKENRELLKRLNSLLTRARRQLIDKNYNEYFSTTRKAFHAAHDLNNDVLKDYSELFMTFIKDSLAETLTELKIMSSGFFGRKKYRAHVKKAYHLLEEFNNFKIAASNLNSFNISQYSEDE
jgi:hypothetical protein